MEDAAALLREAEDQIEDWLCELDTTWHALLGDAESEADVIRSEALADAEMILASARLEADEIIAAAHATAGEHADVIRALSAAEREAAGDELVALRDAVDRLRRELSRLMDAAFDAFPAVEATSEAIERALETRDEPERRGFLRRLLRR
jgi:hypothetical protein